MVNPDENGVYPTVAVCDRGHISLWNGFNPDEDEVASLNWCREMVSHPESEDLIYECGARICWRAKAPREPRAKVRRFRSKQLDLFYDSGLDKGDG